MDAIFVENLSKTFDLNKEALKDISFTVPTGEIFGFLGPNGSGKTTFVRLLNGILSPTEGKALVLNNDIVSNSLEIHSLCGVMTETALNYENLSGEENLNFFGAMHQMNGENIKTNSEQLLKSLEIYDVRKNKVKTYSTGMKKRLLLARALLHSPKVLFLDEPTSGLDPESAMNVTKMIKKLSIEHGVTIFLCTHQLKYAEEICTLYGFIQTGTLLGVGTFKELLKIQKASVHLEIRGEKIPNIKNAQILSDEKVRVPIDSDLDVSKILYEILSNGGKVFEAKQIGWNLEDLYFSFQKEVMK